MLAAPLEGRPHYSPPEADCCLPQSEDRPYRVLIVYLFEKWLIFLSAPHRERISLAIPLLEEEFLASALQRRQYPLLSLTKVRVFSHLSDPADSRGDCPNWRPPPRPQSAFDKGTSKRAGLFPRQSNQQHSATLQSCIQSWCDTGDPYCDSGTTVSAYTSYLSRYQTAAVNFIIQKIGFSYLSMLGDGSEKFNVFFFCKS